MSTCAQCRSPDAQLQCSLCKRTRYCNATCQKKNWKVMHKHICSLSPPSEPVEGIIIHCQQTRAAHGIFESTQIEPNHPIYTQGYICPALKIAGFELLLYRHTLEDQNLGPQPSLDNQIATYLMVEEADGIAAPQWQTSVGDVTVVRKDGKPLTNHAIETIWMYMDHLMDLAGDDVNFFQGQMNRQSFDRFCARYKKEQHYADLQLPL